MSRTRSCIHAASIALFTLTGCVTHWAERNEVMEINLSGARTVTAESHNGDVTLRGGAAPADQLVVKAKLRAGAGSKEAAQEALDAMELKSSVTGDVCEISYIWREPRKTGWQASVDYDISAPSQINSRLTSHNGDIRVMQTQGTVWIQTHNGQCVAESVQGDCKIESHNGDVHVASTGGDLTLETFNGDIVASGQPKSVEIKSHNGEIQLKVSGSQSLTGSVETYNGDVVLTADPGLSTQFVIDTGNGHIQSDLALQNSKVSKSSLTGVMGTPSGKLQVSTHNGDVVLRNGK